MNPSLTRARAAIRTDETEALDQASMQMNQTNEELHRLASVTEQAGFRALLEVAFEMKKKFVGVCCKSQDALKISRAQGALEALNTLFEKFLDAKKAVVTQAAGSQQDANPAPVSE